MRSVVVVQLSVAFAVIAAGCTTGTNNIFSELPAKHLPSLDPGNAPGGQPGDPSSPVLGPDALVERFALTTTSQRTVERYKDVDLLWIIDNSGSMDIYQDRIARGFRDFANTYFTANRNIRLGVITTDAYVASNTSNRTKYGPGNGKCYARLLPGIHDGVRPNVAPLNDDCTLSGALPAGRTGRAILSTQNADGSPVDLTRLIADFQVNAKAGTGGQGSERAFQSLYRFLQDNEGRPECAQGDPSCLFRKGKLRGLFFLGDEHSHDQVDGVDHAENALVLMDDAKVVSESRRLATVVKAKVDSFFRALDGSPNGDPSWFVVNIANLSCASDCGFSGGSRNRDERWGPEYAALTDVVKADPANPAAQYSLKADIGQADYTTLLNQVGRSLETEVERLVVSAFMLAQAPSTTVSPVVSVVLADSTRIRVDAAAVKLTGQQVEINQSALPSPLPDNAQLEVRYLPAG